jgi:uncharacterized membrane protein YeiH
VSTLITVPPLIETAAILGGSLSGALHASRRQMDVMGVALVAVATGVGGGALRDVLLAESVPIFLLNSYVLLAVIGAALGFFFARLVARLETPMFALDTLMIGFWVVIGAEKALSVGLPSGAVIFLGVTTAVGGGLLRDVLCREIPSPFMPGQWVAATALISAILFTVISTTGALALAEATAILAAIILRLSSARYHWITPSAVDLSDRLTARLARSPRVTSEDASQGDPAGPQ